MPANTRRHHDHLHNGLTFSARDNPIYPKLCAPILPKRYMLLIGDTLRHTRSPIQTQIVAMFTYIAYHHQVANIHFGREQSSLESCTNSKLVDHFTPTSYHTKWHSTFMSIQRYVRYYISSCKLLLLVVATNCA
jgi:hypothetical protein